MLNLRNPSGQNTITGISIRDSGNVLRICGTAYIRDAGSVLRTVFSSGASVKVTPAYAAGYVNNKAPTRVVTSFVTLAISGGVAPYTVAWTFSDAGWNATATGTSTGFRSPSISAGSDASTSAFATVTDTNGTVFTSDPIEITASNLGNS